MILNNNHQLFFLNAFAYLSPGVPYTVSNEASISIIRDVGISQGYRQLIQNGFEIQTRTFGPFSPVANLYCLNPVPRLYKVEFSFTYNSSFIIPHLPLDISIRRYDGNSIGSTEVIVNDKVYTEFGRETISCIMELKRDYAIIFRIAPDNPASYTITIDQFTISITEVG